MKSIVCIREHPEYLDTAVEYFSSRWKIARELYYESISDSIYTERHVPRWYLMLRGEEILGGYGLIENDFMKGTDLCPWLCALYIEPSERGYGFGGTLLEHGRIEATKLGYGKLFLNTDHVDYYEKYGWKYIGDSEHQNGEMTRVYEIECNHI
jgi:GNAT superfamily N-acetyltransferase